MLQVDQLHDSLCEYNSWINHKFYHVFIKRLTTLLIFSLFLTLKFYLNIYVRS